MALIWTVRAIAIAAYVSLLAISTSTLAFAAPTGVFWLSTLPLTPGLLAVMFGPRYMATSFDIVFLSHQFGASQGA